MKHLENSQPDPHNIDLRTIDGGKQIFPSVAEGSTVRNLPVESMTIPVSFKVVPPGYFRLNGLLENSSVGLVMSGFLHKTEAKVNHVIVDPELRDLAKERSEQVGKVALQELEQSLRENGITTIYAVFYTPETIDFFLRNGYSIQTIDQVSQVTKTNLGMDADGFDTTVVDKETFEYAKQTNPEDIHHVLLVKNITF